jgi:TonB family protein
MIKEMTSSTIALESMPPRAPTSLWRSGWTWAVSLAVHVALVAVCGGWMFRSLTAGALPSVVVPGDRLVGVELPVMTETSLSSEGAAEALRNPVGTALRLSGGTTIARVDTGRDGRGGDVTVDRPATHLSDVDDRMRLSHGTPSRLDRDQVQRVRSHGTRSSWEDRRSVLEPMELSFLSSGDLARMERRMLASRDPSRGALVSAPASDPGGVPGAAAMEGDELAGIPGASRAGSQASAPGEGVRDGVPGLDHRTAAAVAFARPDVTRAPTSVEARLRGRPRDDVDSEQELASRVEALVHASTAGGVVGRDGVGGSGGGGAPGALGLVGPGSHPGPLGDGFGDWFDLGSSDPRVVAYFRRFHAKVDPLWANAFPRTAMLDLKQGTVILEITIAADGTARVSWPPARPSGVDEFDRNCADAVRRASPFDPIPKELGLTTLHVRAPFVASNPIVH